MKNLSKMTEFSTQVQRQELVEFNILHKSYYTIYLMRYCGPVLKNRTGSTHSVFYSTIAQQ